MISQNQKSQRTLYDPPWKNVIHRFFPAFLEFCLPLVAMEIDWSRSYESLDKELLSIYPNQENGNRRMDFLFKVWLKTGTEVYLLLHVEIQVYKDKHFEKRMYVYHYRSFDRHDKPVLSIAILADANPNWRPRLYEYNSWYNRLEFEFATIKLLDYTAQLPALMKLTNPFAIVIWAHLESLKTNKKPEQRLQSKLMITRCLYKSGFSKEDIIDLLRFIDWVLNLPAPFELEYTQHIQQLEEEKHVDYITSFERFAIKKGLKKGMEEGLEKGMEKGMKKGQLKGERLTVISLFQHRFGQLPAQYQEKLVSGNQKQLLHWGKCLLDAKSLEEIFIG